MAHRVAWELSFGPVPAGLFVCHHCDNPRCVRPDHLFVGTHDANMRDRDRKGRLSHGERHVMARLTTAQVAEIRRRWRQGGVTQQRLADEFGVVQTGVSRIVLDRSRRRG